MVFKFRRTGSTIIITLWLAGCLEMLVPDPEAAYQECLKQTYNGRAQATHCIATLHSLDLQGQELADVHFMLAIHQQSYEFYPQSIENFNEALRLNPQDGDAYFYRGWSYEALGNAEQALDDYYLGYELTGDPRFRKTIDEFEHYLAQLEAESNRTYTLRFNGFYCAKVQKDSILYPANEIFINVIVNAEDGSYASKTLPAPGRTYNNIKKGSKKRGGVTVWQGRAQALSVQVAMWEYDNGGPLVGQLTDIAVDFAISRGSKTLAKHAVRRGANAGAANAGSKAGSRVVKNLDLTSELSRHISSLPKAFFGTDNDLVGHAGIANVWPDEFGSPGHEAGFNNHLKTQLRRGGADCRVYLEFVS